MRLRSSCEPATIEPGINYTHAPQVWALGFTGQNIVVASADTGVRWTHNALKPHYRGWDGVTPITITTGMTPFMIASATFAELIRHFLATIAPWHAIQQAHAIGDDGMGNQIGMAPGAKWIGCRNMDAGQRHTGEIHRVHGMVPRAYPIGGTPNEGDPTKAPDITINSWNCPASEGCSC